MSQPEKLAAAASAIATALEPLTPSEREKAIQIANLMCPSEPVKPARARRSDAGTKRKADALKSLDCTCTSDPVGRCVVHGILSRELSG